LCKDKTFTLCMLNGFKNYLIRRGVKILYQIVSIFIEYIHTLRECCGFSPLGSFFKILLL
jgi:hypothetical protein